MGFFSRRSQKRVKLAADSTESLVVMIRNQTFQLDPLYIIFEKNLVQFEDESSDRDTFIDAVVKEYLKYLRYQSIAVPRALERAVCEELSTQVRGMLIKKIYGFLTISDYQDTIDPKEIKKAKTRYKRLQKLPPAKKSA